MSFSLVVCIAEIFSTHTQKASRIEAMQPICNLMVVSIPARGARCIEVAMKFTTMDLQFQSPQGVRDASWLRPVHSGRPVFQSPQGVRDASIPNILNMSRKNLVSIPARGARCISWEPSTKWLTDWVSIPARGARCIEISQLQ